MIGGARTWLFEHLGKATTRPENDTLRSELGSALSTLRDTQPELWRRAKLAKTAFDQPRAGFEPALLCEWTHEHQGLAVPCSMSMKVLFAAGFAEEACATQYLFLTIGSLIFPRTTAALSNL